MQLVDSELLVIREALNASVTLSEFRKNMRKLYPFKKSRRHIPVMRAGFDMMFAKIKAMKASEKDRKKRLKKAIAKRNRAKLITVARHNPARESRIIDGILRA